MSATARKPSRPRLIERIFEWAWLKAADHRTVDGLLIAGDNSEIDKVAEALSLIRQHDPIRYRRLTQDLKRIWVTILPGYRGCFIRASWTCELEERFVRDENTTPDLVASVIVHEATHARLERVGISYEESARARIEQVCIRQQLVFAARLPQAGELQLEASALLENLPSMSNEAMAERFSAGWANAARHYKFPEWLIRIAVTRLERRQIAVAKDSS
ncbi:hypothetical protein LGH82_24120 [Mesorhizobium sp. PAMC28654]|uniref:hypothetical protein n=1 Tax=Mesorhizobium sp. PAMC28654 TaxID=2880934 RepID=UPI001D0A091B|nr:hypothetical protein [Mesorhizobium sp. PAMC28654]UDL88219.1 hypothetical protein LGH82_24120 [Mesorhizobium sp. PAMC28654]